MRPLQPRVLCVLARPSVQVPVLRRLMTYGLPAPALA